MAPFGDAQPLDHVPIRLSLGNLSRLGVLGAAVCSLLLSFAVLYQRGFDEGLLCLGATGALVAVALPLALGQGRRLYEPVWFVIFIVATGITGKAFYILFGSPESAAFLLLDKQPRDFLFAALIVAAGLFCLSCGYLAGNLRWRWAWLGRLARIEWHPRRFPAVIGILVTIGLLSFALFAVRVDVSFDSLGDLSSKRFGSLEDSVYKTSYGYLRWGASLLEVAFFLGLAKWAAGRRRLLSYPGLFVAGLAVLAMLFPFFVSSRQSALFVLIRALVIWLCLRGEPRPRYFLALGAAGALLISSMLAFRQGRPEWESLRGYLGTEGVLQATLGGHYFLDLSKTAHLLDAVPERVDYQFGKSWVTWLAAPIPRSMWRDKPLIGVGRELGPLVFGTPQSSGVPPGIIGELHLNFGLQGVFVGLLAAGFLLRSLYSTMARYLSSPGAAVLYSVLVTRFALGMLSNSVSGDLARLLQETIPLLLAIYACRGRIGDQAGSPPVPDRVRLPSNPRPFRAS